MTEQHESTRMSDPVIPTGDRRHIAKIRDGLQSSEVFCKDNNRRGELGLAPIPDPEEVEQYA